MHLVTKLFASQAIEELVENVLITESVLHIARVPPLLEKRQGPCCIANDKKACVTHIKASAERIRSALGYVSRSPPHRVSSPIRVDLCQWKQEPWFA